MTAKELARQVARDYTGPIGVTRYACDALEEGIERAIRKVVAAEREACAQLAYKVASERGRAHVADMIVEAIRARSHVLPG